MTLTRREFIKKGGASLLLIGLSGPLGLLDWERAMAAGDTSSNVLVMLQLSGGNDGLNTVIPYGIGAYYDNRPTLGIAQSQVLKLDNQLGLHPSLSRLKALFDRQKLAIINGVGYPNPSRSHFRSQDIWQTAIAERDDVSTGWLGRYLDLLQTGTPNPLLGVSVGSSSKIFFSRKTEAPVINEVANFQPGFKWIGDAEHERRIQALRAMYGPESSPTSPFAIARAKGGVAIKASDDVQQTTTAVVPSGYPNTELGNQLGVIAQLISGGAATRAYFTQLGGFDDHAQELYDHAHLLDVLDEGLNAFYLELERRGIADRVTIIVYSEFGRRVKENANFGTDHGTAAPVLVLGGRVQGGLYGQMPSLTSLDAGDLNYAVDFRSIYGTVLDKWLGGSSQTVLGRSYESLPFL